MKLIINPLVINNVHSFTPRKVGVKKIQLVSVTPEVVGVTPVTSKVVSVTPKVVNVTSTVYNTTSSGLPKPAIRLCKLCNLAVVYDCTVCTDKKYCDDCCYKRRHKT